MDADGLLLVATLCEDDIVADSIGRERTQRVISCHIDTTCFATTLTDFSLQNFLLFSKNLYIDCNPPSFLKDLVFSHFCPHFPHATIIPQSLLSFLSNPWDQP